MKTQSIHIMQWIQEKLIPVAFILMLIMLIPSIIIHSLYNSTWFCEVYGWHRAPKTQGFDGCSKNGCCPVCDKKVMQDGQGNWF